MSVRFLPSRLDERGVASIEYGLLLSLVLVAALAAIIYFGTNTNLLAEAYERAFS